MTREEQIKHIAETVLEAREDAKKRMMEMDPGLCSDTPSFNAFLDIMAGAAFSTLVNFAALDEISIHGTWEFRDDSRLADFGLAEQKEKEPEALTASDFGLRVK